MTVKEMKSGLALMGLAVGGTKDVLTERIHEEFSRLRAVKRQRKKLEREQDGEEEDKKKVSSQEIILD